MLVSFFSYSCVLITNDFFYRGPFSSNLMSRVRKELKRSEKLFYSTLFTHLPDPFPFSSAFPPWKPLFSAETYVFSPCPKSKIKTPQLHITPHNNPANFQLLHVERTNEAHFQPWRIRRASRVEDLKLIKNKMFSFSFAIVLNRRCGKFSSSFVMSFT